MKPHDVSSRRTDIHSFYQQMIDDHVNISMLGYKMQ